MRPAPGRNFQCGRRPVFNRRNSSSQTADRCHTRLVRVLIIGCGYVGTALGRRLVDAGHEVFALRRSAVVSAAPDEHGFHPLTGDITDPASLAALPETFDVVANTVSSSRGDADVYRQVYLEGTRHVLDWLRVRGCRRYVYTSSTSVYAQKDGSVVTEASPAEPATETGRLLVATEQLLRESAPSFPGAIGIFRVAGIYGPTRGHLYQQFLRGEARLTGDGSRLINMIHRDDVAAALAAFLTAPSLPHQTRLYNTSDDESVTQREFFEWLARRLDRAMPPVASPSEVAASKRGQTQKRVSNQRLRDELHWQPMYPTFREGYEAIIRDNALRTGPRA